MDLGLTGRPALVAAASRGLGKACALSLAAEGARVAITARDAGALEAAADEITEATGATVVAIPADVSREAGRFVREGAEALGGCEILVANAGGPPFGRFEDFTDDDFQAALELSFFSTLRMTREALPWMRQAGFGRIIVIGSSAVKEPIPNLVLSNATRAGVAGWAKTMSREVASEGITVNTVLPGRFDTDRVRALLEAQAEREGRALDEVREASAGSIPAGRFGEPRELGDVVAFIASERSGYLTGAVVQVDGGMLHGLL